MQFETKFSIVWKKSTSSFIKVQKTSFAISLSASIKQLLSYICKNNKWINEV